MNELLRQRYIQMAKDNSCRVAPVTSIWRDLRDSTQLDLYEPDGSHPSPVGSLVIAGVIYSTLFDKPLTTGKFAPFVNDNENLQIINTTNSIIKDSASLWNYEYQLSVKNWTKTPILSNQNAVVLTPLHSEILTESWNTKQFDSYVILDNLGQEVLTSELNPKLRTLKLDITQMKSGLYFVIPVKNKAMDPIYQIPIWIQQ
jgi:hypothetical protein